ncbi:hypothetical protein GOODEAATRI_006222 [Goodea atripinnis]|uniref:Ectonucleotide pyrophosphatase/phosphodiesterase family member 7-like n=1 Tax=Goodea atripinnis TaxID=208336 RepID=A0ABV0N0L1_9TELE
MVVISINGKPVRNREEKKTKLLLMSFDGFRWDYDQDVDTPHMDQMALDGVKAKYLTPPMLTMTAPSHFTTITGRWVEDHEVVHNLMFNTTTNLKVPYKQTLTRSEWGQKVNRVWMEEPGHPKDNFTEWLQNIDTVMSWFAEEDFDLVTLYYGEPDNVGHAKGPDHPDRKLIIQQIDRTIGYLRQAINHHNLTDTLDVIITSDHGMTTVKKRPLVDEIILNKYLNLLELASFEILDYGGFGILTPRPGKDQEVFDALSNAPNLTVYKKHEIPESFHLGRSERLPPIVVVADLGFNLNSEKEPKAPDESRSSQKSSSCSCFSPFLQRLIIYINKGDHGFHNGEMDMKTIFRALGPSFKKNFVSEPFDSIHIYPLLCKLLKIEPAPHNGSLEVTEAMLWSGGE